VILAYAIILLIILALLLRRDLSALGRMPYRGGWQVAAAVIGLFVLQAALIVYVSGQSTWQMVLLILSQIVLILLLLLNHHVPGANVFALGIILNTTVMVANGGWMPVTPETQRFVHPDRPVEVGAKPPSSKNIVLLRSETKLWFLSDIIRVTLPWRRNAISIGDVLLIVGAALFIFQIDLKKAYLNKTKLKRGGESRCTSF
jgi:hypothetical protein